MSGPGCTVLPNQRSNAAHLPSVAISCRFDKPHVDLAPIRQDFPKWYLLYCTSPVYLRINYTTPLYCYLTHHSICIPPFYTKCPAYSCISTSHHKLVPVTNPSIEQEQQATLAATSCMPLLRHFPRARSRPSSAARRRHPLSRADFHP